MPIEIGMAHYAAGDAIGLTPLEQFTTYRRLLAGTSAPAEVWRAPKTEGGYGVVKGSLRVLA